MIPDRSASQRSTLNDNTIYNHVSISNTNGLPEDTNPAFPFVSSPPPHTRLAQPHDYNIGDISQLNTKSLFKNTNEQCEGPKVCGNDELKQQMQQQDYVNNKDLIVYYQNENTNQNNEIYDGNWVNVDMLGDDEQQRPLKPTMITVTQTSRHQVFQLDEDQSLLIFGGGGEKKLVNQELLVRCTKSECEGQVFPNEEDDCDEEDIANEEERMVMEVVLSGQLHELRHFSSEIKSLNFLSSVEQITFDKKVSPLLVAVLSGNVEIVKKLFGVSFLDRINVDFASHPKRLSPLMTACLQGQYEIAQFLVLQGADVSLVSNSNESPLSCCFTRLYDERLSCFENWNLCLSIAEFLLDNGADVNGILDAEHQLTLLLRICRVADMDFTVKPSESHLRQARLVSMEFLIRHGAELTAKDISGQDCVDWIEAHPCSEEALQVLMNSAIESTSVKGQKQMSEKATLMSVMNRRSHYQTMLASTSPSSQMILQQNNLRLSTQLRQSHCSQGNRQIGTTEQIQTGIDQIPLRKTYTQIQRREVVAETMIEAEEPKHLSCCNLLTFFQ